MHFVRFIRLLLPAFLIGIAGHVHTHAQVALDRGMSQPTVFVPKGEWITGVSVSYSAQKYNDYSFLIIEGIKGRGYTFKVSPTLLYAFADNLAAGARGSYSRTFTHLDKGAIVVSSDMGLDIDNLYSLSHSYGGAALFRDYIALGGSRRFGIIAEIMAELKGSQSKLASGTGQALSGTYQTSFGLNIGVTPGMVMMLNSYSALEVNIGVLGFNYNRIKATTDQIYEANIKTKSANFKINIFSITFGCMFYI